MSKPHSIGTEVKYNNTLQACIYFIFCFVFPAVKKKELGRGSVLEYTLNNIVQVFGQSRQLSFEFAEFAIVLSLPERGLISGRDQDEFEIRKETVDILT